MIATAMLGLRACTDTEDSGSNSRISPEGEEQLNGLLNSYSEEPNIVGTMIAVKDDTGKGSFGMARGTAVPASGEPMSTSHQFHIASMTKPFTSVLVLQLIEEGHFTLETSLADAFGDATFCELFPNHEFGTLNADGVPVGDMSINDIQRFQGESRGASITIRQLLQLDVDSAGWNTSFDWAGGGLVSTAEDIDAFYRGVFDDRILEDSSVIGDEAYRVTGDDQSPVAGLGFALNIDQAVGDVLSYEHGGFWGSYMFYFPKQETSVVFTANQAEFQEYVSLVGTVRSLFASQVSELSGAGLRR